MDRTTLTDEELILHIRVPGHFEELYRRHVDKVTAFATRRCAAAHEVPDLVAAVWLEVIASAHRFDRGKGHPLPWILGVAANLTASNERRGRREREAIERLGRHAAIDHRTADELDEQIDAVATARGALEMFGRLPLKERVVAELVLIDGLEPQEAAKALGIRPATARMRLLRARKKLQSSVAQFRVNRDHPLSAREA